jgi:soluble lytic murein transglycosylase-like protein
MDLVFARSRRRAAARRAEPPRKAPVSWRTVRALVLALALLGFIATESTRLDNAPAKSAARTKIEAVAMSCGIPTAFAGGFRAASRETGLPLSLLAAVAWEESRMDPEALSGAGARGLLQLMPATARALALSESSPRANILAGAHYLKQMIDRFDGDLELALAAYNAGPTAVEKAGAAPSLATLRYAKNVEARAANLAGCA